MGNIAREKTGQSWADISVSCALRRKDVPLLPMPGWGLYGWRIEGKKTTGVLNEGYLKAIRQTKPRAITFHYVSPAEMRAIHEETHSNRSNASNASSSRLLSEEGSYEEQLACYLAADRVPGVVRTC